MKFDPDAFGRRMPIEWFERYRRGVEGPAGELDDSRKLVRVGLFVLLGFFALLLGWGALAPLSGAAIANGVVTVAGNRQPMQTLNGGVVDAVLVREGQAVQAGQPLVRVTSLGAGTQYRQSQAQRDALAAAEARLVAERDGLETIAWPADFAERSSEPSVSQAVGAQTGLFSTRASTSGADRGIERSQVAQARAKVEGPRRQLAYVRERVAGLRMLYDRGFAPKSVLYELEAARVQLETELAVNEAALTQAELTARRAEDVRKAEVHEQLRTIQVQLQQVNPSLSTARFAAERDVIRAPANGVVVDLAPVAAGAVLNPGQRILDVLPANRSLIVEARIRPQDVDDVRVGSLADVRFTTVNPRGRSNIGGKVTTLSADRITDEATGTDYYLAYIALDARDIEDAGITITPGLPASVNVRTRSRSLLDYLLSPFFDAFAKAGREE